jgi:hypothetical protein
MRLEDESLLSVKCLLLVSRQGVSRYPGMDIVYLQSGLPLLRSQSLLSNSLGCSRCSRSVQRRHLPQAPAEDWFRDPWFTRVWVLQEVCAKSSVQFISDFASFSYTSVLKLYVGYRGTTVTRKYWPLALQWICVPPREFSTPQLNLWNRLEDSREYLATEPKYRVFDLKSLIGSGQSEMNLLIDYAQSLEECYTRVATFLLPVLGLRLFTAVRHPHDKKMPSWISN